MVLLLTMFGSGYAFGTVFIACDLGQRLNDAFAEIGELLYQCDWHLFSNKMRRTVVVILTVLQQPVSLQCFGSIGCNREVFKKVSKLVKRNQSNQSNQSCIYSVCGNSFQVVNSAFSYFLALRQFGN